MQEEKEEKTLTPSQADCLFDAVMEQLRPRYLEALDMRFTLITGGIKIDPRPILQKHGKNIVDFTQFKTVYFSEDKNYRIPLKIQDGTLLPVEKKPYTHLIAFLDIAYDPQTPRTVRVTEAAPLSKKTGNKHSRLAEEISLYKIETRMIIELIIKDFREKNPQRFPTSKDFISALKEGNGIKLPAGIIFAKNELSANLRSISLRTTELTAYVSESRREKSIETLESRGFIKGDMLCFQATSFKCLSGIKISEIENNLYLRLCSEVKRSAYEANRKKIETFIEEVYVQLDSQTQEKNTPDNPFVILDESVEIQEAIESSPMSPTAVAENLSLFWQTVSTHQSLPPAQSKPRIIAEKISLFKVETRMIMESIIKDFREKHPQRFSTSKAFISALKKGNGIQIPEEISFAKNELSANLRAISLSATDLTASQNPKLIEKTIQKLKDKGLMKEDTLRFQAVRFNCLRGIIISKIGDNLYLQLCPETRPLTYKKNRNEVKTFIEQVYRALPSSSMETEESRHNPSEKIHQSKFYGLLMGVIIYQALMYNPTLMLAETLRQKRQVQIKSDVYFSEGILRKVFATIYGEDASDNFNYAMRKIKKISVEEESQWHLDPSKVLSHQKRHFAAKDNEIAVSIYCRHFWLSVNTELSESFKTIEGFIQELRTIATADRLAKARKRKEVNPSSSQNVTGDENLSGLRASTAVYATPSSWDWMEVDVDDLSIDPFENLIIETPAPAQVGLLPDSQSPDCLPPTAITESPLIIWQTGSIHRSIPPTQNKPHSIAEKTKLYRIETRIIIESIIKIFRGIYLTSKNFISALEKDNGIKLPEGISFATNELSAHLQAISLSATDLTSSLQNPLLIVKAIQNLRNKDFIKEDTLLFQAASFKGLSGIIISKIGDNRYLKLCQETENPSYKQHREEIEAFIEQIYKALDRQANKRPMPQEILAPEAGDPSSKKVRGHSSGFWARTAAGATPPAQDQGLESWIYDPVDPDDPFGDFVLDDTAVSTTPSAPEPTGPELFPNLQWQRPQ